MRPPCTNTTHLCPNNSALWLVKVVAMALMLNLVMGIVSLFAGVEMSEADLERSGLTLRVVLTTSVIGYMLHLLVARLLGCIWNAICSCCGALGRKCRRTGSANKPSTIIGTTKLKHA